MSENGVERYPCDYCRGLSLETRPAAVKNREHIPELCSECFGALLDAGRYDRPRDKEVFFP